MMLCAVVLQLVLVCVLVGGGRSIGVTQLNSFSGVISATILQSSDSFQWIIAPASPSASSIQLIFQSMVLKSAQINIYDTAQLNIGTLYSCVLCSDVMPPAFFSTTGSVTVVIDGVTGAGFLSSSFSLQYVSQPTIRAAQLSNITINLNAGYGKIAPQLFGGILVANSIQRWKITQPTGGILIFSFAKFSFGAVCSSRIRVYDNIAGGNLLFSGCTQSDYPIAWVYSTTGKALVVLTAGSSDQAVGFQITFDSDAELYRCGSKVQPDVLSDRSMIISDGSLNSNDMRRSQSCIWLISPDTVGTVTLFFSYVSLKIGSSVVIYDNSAASGTVLWNGMISTKDSTNSLIVPPPLTSTGRSLYVIFLTNSFASTTFKGFRGTYQSNYIGSTGIGSGQTQLSMSSAIDINPPGNGLTYIQGNNYSWSVQPAYISGTITFVFSLLQLINSTDVLTIYDGSTLAPSNILARYSGPTVTPHSWVTTRSTTATVVFTSVKLHPTSSPNFNGNFKLSYFSDGPNYHCGFTTNPALLTASSMTFTDGSPSGTSAYQTQYCVWTLAPKDSTAMVLLFNRFSLFGARLDIYSGPVATGTLLFSIADTTAVPAPFLFSSPVMGIAYTSSIANVTSSGLGFSSVYYGISSSVLTPGSGVTQISSSGMLSLSLTAVSAVTTITTVAPTTVSTAFGVPAAISGNTNASWLLKPTSSTGALILAFSYMNLTCPNNYLEIHDGSTAAAPVIGRYCGNTYYTINNKFKSLQQPPVYSWIQTSGTVALLNLVSDSKKRFRNFEISFYSDGPAYHCGFLTNPATLTAPSMILTDGSSSTTSMASSQDCQWLVNPYAFSFPAADKINTTVASSAVPNAQSLFSARDGMASSSVSSDDTRGLRGTGEGITNRVYGDDGNIMSYQVTTTGSNAAGSVSTGVQRTVILEFVESDLFGAVVTVYDGPDVTGALLWQCNGCNTVPRPIVSISNTLYVTFSSSKIGFPKGMGFRSTYWALLSDTSVWQDPTGGLILEVPATLIFDTTVLNSSSSWGLTASLKTSRVAFTPRYSYTDISSSLTDLVVDGRVLGSTFESYVDTDYRDTCGIVFPLGTSQYHSMTPFVTGGPFSLAATQYANTYLRSSSSQKKLSKVVGSSDVTSPEATWGPDVNIFSPADVCKYTMSSGTNIALDITINKFINPIVNGARLQIYGGKYGNDALIFDSYGYTGSTTGLTVTAPCGKATIVLQSNVTGSPVDYSFDFGYQISGGDYQNGNACYKYRQSLLPRVIVPDPYIIYYYLGGAAAVFILLCVALYFSWKHFPYAFFIRYYKINEISEYSAVTPHHPRFTPKLDEFRNKFLDSGMCYICKVTPCKILKLSCNHGLCMEDIRGYLESALGDISQFPVKCPMHYEGCGAFIEATTAKRVLTRALYDRFLDFSDRALYGDGLRCIYCSNFVNFPIDGAMAMVACPYCMKRFCMRCKKPWHPSGEKCPLEKFDETLEAWKEASGAMKCPTCFKLIEKDDPDTCNHMVHKITDGIPCLHDRTDFCYLCGEAVTADYPHDEIRNPGVNHFPDGVFQKCRIITARERDEERDRLRKARRMKIRNATKSKQRKSSRIPFVVGAIADTDWESDVDPLFSAQQGVEMGPLPAPIAVEAVVPRTERAPVRARRRRSQGGSRPNALRPNNEAPAPFVYDPALGLTMAALNAHNQTLISGSQKAPTVAAPSTTGRDNRGGHEHRENRERENIPAPSTGTLKVFDEQWDFELNH